MAGYNASEHAVLGVWPRCRKPVAVAGLVAVLASDEATRSKGSFYTVKGGLDATALAFPSRGGLPRVAAHPGGSILSAPENAAAIDRLVAIMARLRDPKTGCEWDTVQTFATIAPYTIEEAYEVADAIERGDMDDLKDELGDLLLQVIFHSRMAEEAGDFALADVAHAISNKMERRHPHIFLGAAEGGHHLWEQIKAAERGEKGHESALDGVATGLPALLRAEKLQKRAARTGFDWPDRSGARAKVDEELAEVEDATTQAEIEEEVGDLLFAVVNWARKLGVDPEAALRGANAKFEKRFKAMEVEAGDAFEGLDLKAKEELWVKAKIATR